MNRRTLPLERQNGVAMASGLDSGYNSCWDATTSPWRFIRVSDRGEPMEDRDVCCCCVLDPGLGTDENDKTRILFALLAFLLGVVFVVTNPHGRG